MLLIVITYNVSQTPLVTELDVENLVVLSNNLNIDISKEDDISVYEASIDFERMLNKIFKDCAKAQ